MLPGTKLTHIFTSRCSPGLLYQGGRTEMKALWSSNKGDTEFLPCKKGTVSNGEWGAGTEDTEWKGDEWKNDFSLFGIRSRVDRLQTKAILTPYRVKLWNCFKRMLCIWSVRGFSRSLAKSMGDKSSEAARNSSNPTWLRKPLHCKWPEADGSHMCLPWVFGHSGNRQALFSVSRFLVSLGTSALL